MHFIAAERAAEVKVLAIYIAQDLGLGKQAGMSCNTFRFGENKLDAVSVLDGFARKTPRATQMILC